MGRTPHRWEIQISRGQLNTNEEVWIQIYNFSLLSSYVSGQIKVAWAPGWNLERGPISVSVSIFRWTLRVLCGRENEEEGGKRIYFRIWVPKWWGPWLYPRQYPLNPLLICIIIKI